MNPASVVQCKSLPGPNIQVGVDAKTSGDVHKELVRLFREKARETLNRRQ